MNIWIMGWLNELIRESEWTAGKIGWINDEKMDER